MASPSVSSSPAIIGGSTLTNNNHGAAVIITAGVSLGATIIAVSLRLHRRWPWKQLFKWEDALMVAAMTCEIVTIAALTRAVSTGLGQHVSSLLPDAVTQTRRAQVAAFAVTYLAEGLAVTSSILSLQHMMPTQRMKILMWTLFAVVSAWMLAAIVLYAISTSIAPQALDRPTWIALGAIGAGIQLTLLGASMWMIWPRQMDLSKKITCSAYCGLSFFVAAVTIVRLIYTPSKPLRSDYTWSDLKMVVIFLVESNLAIIAAAYPAMRNFLTKVSTGLLVPATKSSQAGSKNGSKGGEYGRQTIGSSNKRKGSSQIQSSHAWEPSHGQVPNLKTSYHAAVARGDAHSERSFGSEVIMVRQSVEIDDGDMSIS